MGRGDRGPGAGAEEPGVGEVLPGEALDELRETARPHAFADAARALADAVVALSEEGDPQAAVRAARLAKRAAPRAAAVREALGIALYQVGDFGAARTELAAALRISGRDDLGALLGHLEAVQPGLLVVDSVQTIASEATDGAAGGVPQIRAVAGALIAVAKERGIATVLVGHVTKDGGIAGPRP